MSLSLSHSFNAVSRYIVKNAELNELYLSLALRHFCLALIGTFVPLYFLKIGFSLREVFIFYAIVSAIQFMLVPFATVLASKIGFKHMMTISGPLTIGLFAVLYSMNGVNWYLTVFTAVLFGAGNIFFRMGTHLDAATNSHGEKRGSELGMINIIESIFKAMAPLAGALILFVFNFQILFIIASIILLISTVPLFMSKDQRDPLHFNLLKSLRGHNIKHTLNYIASGVEFDSNTIVWPIAIYFILNQSYQRVGEVASGSLLVAILVLYFVGKWSNNHRKQVIKITSIGLVITWILRVTVQNTPQILALESAHNSFESGYYIAQDASIYDRSERNGILKYIFYYQLMVNLGRLMMFLLLVIMPDYQFGLILGVIASVIMQFA
jgi:hypothetical protein